ncbi:MAG: hypothetical protein CMP10_18535 [Zetaproteobacteria bacterium]|nr:hypothetical protein [Pseudobdellovibrionaceae bacterium]|tara:strand:+ start:1069 stop:1926 length:858 start_codon:yes stop_codon:yes gene_type:complete
MSYKKPQEIILLVTELLQHFSTIKGKLITRLIAYFMAIVIIGVGGISYFELSVNDQFETLFDVIYYTFTTMSTVGFGDKVPYSVGGKLITIVVILTSVVFVALFSAMVAALFIESKLREEMGMKQTNFTDHIVIIGWNLKGPRIIELLHKKEEFQKKHMVVCADIEKNPLDHPYIAFSRYRGTVHEADLLKASADKAEIIIFLADYSIKQGSDAMTCVNCLVTRKVNPNAKIIVEMLNPQARDYLELAGSDLIIGVGEVGGLMITEACFGNEKIKSTLEELAMFQ